MSEYKPLHELILEGLEEGTVLESDNCTQARCWTNGVLVTAGSHQHVSRPFAVNWRVISTPPKKIEFEMPDGHGMRNGEPYISLPDDHPFSYETPLRVTVEEKR